MCHGTPGTPRDDRPAYPGLYIPQSCKLNTDVSKVNLCMKYYKLIKKVIIMLKGFEISSVFVAVIIQSAATNSVVPLAHESNNQKQCEFDFSLL